METQDLLTDNEVIETDAQQQKNEDEQGDSPRKYPFDDPTKEDADIREDKWSIYQYMRNYDRQKLIIQPDYQRNFVWKVLQKSRFIESILLGFPLPPFYLNQTREGNFIIIDGLQRTTTLHEFFNDKFALENLSGLAEINGKRFSELPDGYKAKIEDKNILVYILKPSTPIEVVYELFERINIGGTSLNRQEVRNGLFQGHSTKLLKNLAEYEYFLKATDNGVSPTRMKDREVVLRYLAFKVFDYEKDYAGDLGTFLENAMRTINKKEELVEVLTTDFQRVTRYAFEIFGKNSFRLPTIDEKGQSRRGVINTCMFETICYFLSKQTDEFLNSNKEKIVANLPTLLKNPNYLEAIKNSTGSKAKVINRFQLAQEILGNIS